MPFTAKKIDHGDIMINLQFSIISPWTDLDVLFNIGWDNYGEVA